MTNEDIHKEYLGKRIQRPRRQYTELVENIYITRNLNNSIVKIEYLVSNDCLGQRVFDLVPATTIQRYLIERQ
jgi:hypothetical protein